MPTLYAWGTPNGHKPLVLLEELGVPYDLMKIDIGAGAQKEPAYLALNPNGRIPAFVDDDGVRVFESGAILLHLAEKHGAFLPKDAQGRAAALSWLFWQMGGVGPMFGQAGHFRLLKEPIPYAINRYTDEVKRLYAVLDARLAEAPYLAGDDYSIADIATFLWVRSPAYFGLDFSGLPNVARWVNANAARPAVKRALAVPFP